MDKYLRELERKQKLDPSYKPTYLAELSRADYLDMEYIQYAAFLGDPAALALFPTVDFSLHPVLPLLHEPEWQTRIRLDERYLKLVTVIQRLPPEKLFLVMLEILKSHYSYEDVSRVITLMEQRLSGKDVNEEIQELLADIENAPFEWSLTAHMDDDHSQMVTSTLRDIIFTLEVFSPEMDLSNHQTNAIVDLMTAIDLGRRYARRIGHKEEVGEEITYGILNESFCKILLKPERQ
jgi:hypothetical protein